MEAKTAAFESPEFGTLSVIFSDSGPWFFGKSVANALRMRDSMYRKSLKAVKEENRKRAGDLVDCEDPAMKQWIFINEEGADRLIRDSEDKPRAMLFRDWMWSQTHPGETPPDFEEEEASPTPREITPADEAAFAGNPILKFTNEMFGEVRVVEIDGEPWFVGRDVSRILGYGGENEDSEAISHAIADHVDEEDKKRCPYWVFESERNDAHPKTGRRGLMIINESGLYSLIMSSRLPSARDFKHWVTHEVLPSVRKHGTYVTDEVLNNILADPDFGIRLLTEIKEERERNRVLTDENNRLTAANDALSEKAVEWKDRAVLSALVKSYSANTHGSDFSAGWNDFYRNLNYDLGINLRLRASVRNGGKLLDALTKDELCSAVRMAAGMCQRAGRSRSPPKSAASG